MRNYLIIIIFLISCQTESGNKQKEKNSQSAELFGEGIISSTFPEFGTSVNKDQTQIFFNRTAADRSTMQIMHSSIVNGKWSEAVSFSFSTGKYRDVDPFLTKAGDRLYFSSDRITPDGLEGIFNTWYINKSDETWSEPILAAAPLNSDSTEIFISIADNGNAYFVSEREERGIVVSRWENGNYQIPENVILKLRGEPIYASNPAISSDEQFLIVTSRDPEGNGTSDLFVSFHQDNEWSELINLGPYVNSSFADFAPGLSKDNQTLYFSSERPGIVGAQEEGVRPPGDIYKVYLTSILAELQN